MHNSAMPYNQLARKYHQYNNLLKTVEAARAEIASHDIAGTDEALKSLQTLANQVQPLVDALKYDIDQRDDYFKKWAKLYCRKTLDELPQQILVVESTIRNGKEAVAKKRKPLLDDGLALDAVAAVYPDYDDSSDRKTLEELQYQLSAWEGFNEYRLPDFLPLTAEQQQEWAHFLSQ